MTKEISGQVRSHPGLCFRSEYRKRIGHYPRNTSDLKSDGKFIMNIYKDSEGDIWLEVSKM